MTSTVTDYYHGMYSLSLMVTYTPTHVHKLEEIEPRGKSELAGPRF